MEKHIMEQTTSNKSVKINDVYEKKIHKIDLIGFGDWHYGDNSCNLDAITKQIAWIKDNKYARVILMGDILNCATRGSVGAGPYDENRKPQKQFEEVLELLEPINRRQKWKRKKYLSRTMMRMSAGL